jgi:hypothetical protein
MCLENSDIKILLWIHPKVLFVFIFSKTLSQTVRLTQLAVKTVVEVNFDYNRNIKKYSFIQYDLFISTPVKFPVLGLTGFSLDAIDRRRGASMKFKGTD